MPKPSKSSASSGTRKKHARKAAELAAESQPVPENAKTRPSKKDIKRGLAPPPKKSYIAPSKLKPVPPQADPLDSIGYILPAELVVVLRRLAKKDGVTKSRALEDLEVWIHTAKDDSQDISLRTAKIETLVAILPVWMHRYPALCVHQSRRTRQLSALIHAALLEIPDVRVGIMNLLENGPETQLSQVLGSWCLSVWDTDRGVATRGMKSWNDAVCVIQGDGGSDCETTYHKDSKFVLNDCTLSQSIWPFIMTTIMDPAATYSALSPSFVVKSSEFATSSHLGVAEHGTPTSTGSSPSSVIRKESGKESKTISRVEDEMESIADRNARLRVGALGALGWLLSVCTPTETLVTLLQSLLSSPMFWTVLHHAAYPPFLPLHLKSDNEQSSLLMPGSTEGFGLGQTVVRRAGWGIVHALIGDRRSESKDFSWKKWNYANDADIVNQSSSANFTLRLISSAILRSAFVEPDPVVRSSMWEPLLVSLTKIDDAWLLDYEYGTATLSTVPHTDVESDSKLELSTSGDKTGSNLPRSSSGADSGPRSSVAYREFLTFLSLGCNGSPIHGYPTVLVILSTIPKEVLDTSLPAITGFFDGLWSAIDGHALNTLSAERARGTEAFLGAWGECLIWMTAKLLRHSNASVLHNGLGDSSPVLTTAENLTGNETSKTPAYVLVNLQLEKLIGEIGNGLKIDARTAGVKVAIVIERLENLEQDLRDDTWVHIFKYSRATISDVDNEVQRKYALSFLAALYQHLQSQASRCRLEKLVSELAWGIVARYRTQESNGEVHGSSEQQILKDGGILEMLLEWFADILAADEVYIQLLNDFLNANMSALIIQPTLVLSYLKHISNIANKITAWHLLLSTLGSSLDLELNEKMEILKVLLDAANHSDLAVWARPRGRELPGLAERLLAEALSGDSTASDLVAGLLQMPGPFIDVGTAQALVSKAVATVDSHIQPLIYASVPLSIKTLHSSLRLLLALKRDAPDLHLESSLVDVLPRIFVLAFVMPDFLSLEEELKAADLAKRLWVAWRDSSDIQLQSSVISDLKTLLKSLILDTDALPRPAAILCALPQVDHSTAAQPLDDVLPTQSEFNTLLLSTSTIPIDSSLAIVEPLAPSSSIDSSAEKSRWNTKFDGSGFSPYARGVSALLHILVSDRHLARENMWTLRHALTLMLFANEVIQVPQADSPVFKGQKVAASELGDIMRLTKQIAAFLLTSTGDGSWHKDVVNVLSGKSSNCDLDSLGEFVQLVFEQSTYHDTVRESWVLHTVLEHVLRGATRDDADKWIELARSGEEQALQTSMAISLAVTEVALEPQRLDRYRNEVASKLAGVSSNKANTIGLRLLRSLSAVAPNPESDVIFLPQQRAVYLVQALQAWFASDDELDLSVESEIPLVLFYLAPILQNVQGAHWEFTMDLIESNIENSSFEDADTLVMLSRTLRLLTITRDLSFSNKYLRELWNQRQNAIFLLVRDLVATRTDRMTLSQPMAICRGQALSILQELPGSLINENTLSAMCHLLTDPSVEVQKVAYHILQRAAIIRTEYLVVEAGVDSENATIVELPRELVSLLQSRFGHADTGEPDPFAYLLGWMIVYDLFIGASLKVKSSYVDHLRTLNLIGEYFLPNIFEFLGVDTLGSSFKPNPWVVEEYWLMFYDTDAPHGLQLLATHLYYRALLIVPSLIRTYWEDLKDRQLSAAIAAFTSSYFSPILISSELIHVKPGSGASRDVLNDEAFNVKVATAINDVTATFTVDDQQMEIGIRLPVGYPLKTVDVRPIRRVGVPEKVWRRWLFAVQQVVTSHNGRIVDGLALFKKTASLHFEGQVECAICYSILHVVDRSLPAKPCKTCKNRFHAACLYKWFSTSHSSSCPLCRSDIM